MLAAASNLWTKFFLHRPQVAEPEKSVEFTTPLRAISLSEFLHQMHEIGVTRSVPSTSDRRGCLPSR